MNSDWTKVARCPACEYQETADDDWRVYHPNLCPACGTRFFLSVRHTPSYQSRIIPPPHVVSVTLEPGQIWRGMGPISALRLDQYEPAHGPVGEGWYVTFGTIDSERRRLVKEKALYSPGPDPIGPNFMMVQRKLASLFKNPWAHGIDADEWYGIEIALARAT